MVSPSFQPGPAPLGARARWSAWAGRWWWVAVLLLSWDLYVRIKGFNVIVLPSPLDVARSLVADGPELLANLLLTLRAALLGLLLGAVLGTLAAVLAWISRVLSGLVAPLALLVRSVPFIVFIPILSRFMGYDTTMEVVVVGMLSFFPSFVLVSSGLAGLPAAASDLCAVYGAPRWRRLWLIALPAAIPNLFASIRISASVAVLVAMVAEYLTGIEGLGRMFLLTRGELEADRSLAVSAVAAVTSLLLFNVAKAAEQAVNRRMS
jgi:ABC-type nitrate/sulfonate/bicarbonate transport system permease component